MAEGFTFQPFPSILARKLTEVMLEVEGVAKNRENKAQGYKFASEEGFLRAVRGPLATKGVLMRPTSVVVVDTTRSETKSGGFTTTITSRVEYTFTDSETGESMAVEVLASGADSGDKHSYKLMTGALKYALKQSLLLPTGDDPEYEGASPVRTSAQGTRTSALKAQAPAGMDRVAFEGSLMLLSLTPDQAKELVGLPTDQPWSKKFATLEAALADVQKAVASKTESSSLVS